MMFSQNTLNASTFVLFTRATRYQMLVSERSLRVQERIRDTRIAVCESVCLTAFTDPTYRWCVRFILLSRARLWSAKRFNSLNLHFSLLHIKLLHNTHRAESVKSLLQQLGSLMATVQCPFGVQFESRALVQAVCRSDFLLSQ